jgi:D-glycero-alpha-D-manno-heptose 1-phosphate guanylyltransferase
MAEADEAIVLVGGLGTRLRAVVNDVPKPLAAIRGKPFLTYLLDLLADNHIKKVVLATGYMGDVIVASIGHRWRGMEVEYSDEDSPLGTGGAIAQAASRLDGEAFYVLNGDTYVDLDYAAFDAHMVHCGAVLGMALSSVPDTARYGAVQVENGRVVGFVEKGVSGPGYINAGVYRLSRPLLASLPQKGTYSFETDVLIPLVAQGSVVAFTSNTGFIDIGVPEDYLRAQEELCPRSAEKP